MGKIILITGGQRSGKSTYAERLALDMSGNPVYLATATIGDEEMAERVRRHRERRGPQWINLEEPIRLSQFNLNGKTVLVDCLTLWATNIFFDQKEDADCALKALKEEFDRLTRQEADFILVTNEIGMSGISPNAMARKFTDLLGFFNQYVASRADEVVLMVSGIPLKIKQNEELQHKFS